ncbi:MAG: hypothetical protein ACYTEL_17015 [Planctomycetota bacterium]|jgi:hypothetical protein
MKITGNSVLVAGAVVLIAALLVGKLPYSKDRSICTQEPRRQEQTVNVKRPPLKPSEKQVMSPSAPTQPADACDGSRTTEYVWPLEDLANEVIDEMRPLDWQRQRFDGRAEHFSKEDLRKARRIVSRYFDNFSKIRSIKFDQSKTCEFLVDNELTRSAISRKHTDAHNYTFRVEATRSPVYLRIQGSLAGGELVAEIVTPAGKFTSGHITYAESFLPAYLDGEKWVNEYSLLKYGDRVKENVSMDYDLPRLAETIGSKDLGNTKYDVVEDKKDDVGLVNTYWFNRNSGMLDFLITRRTKPDTDASPIYSVTMIDYYEANGLYYFKGYVCYDCDFQVKYQENITNLVVSR